MTIEGPAGQSHRGAARSPATAETIPSSSVVWTLPLLYGKKTGSPAKCRFPTPEKGLEGGDRDCWTPGGSGLWKKAEMKGIRCQLLCIGGGLKSSRAGHMPIWD